MNSEAAARNEIYRGSKVPSLQPKSHLLSDSLDVWAAGLASILVFALSFLLIERSTSTNSLGWTAYYLGFVINWPHFMMSYQLLYSHAWKSLGRWQVLWAAFLCPVILIAAFTLVGLQGSASWMSWMIQLMFLTVGWHYAKQSFGITLVFCHLKGYKLSAGYKRSLKASLIGAWLLNWGVLNASLNQHEFYGFNYTQLGVPSVVGTVFLCFLSLSVLIVLYFGIRHYFKSGEVPPKAAFFTWLAMLVWYLPVLYHPVFFLFVAFFHSLQYVLFVSAYRREKVRHEELVRWTDSQEVTPLRRERVSSSWEGFRKRVFRRHLVFYSGAILSGYLLFEGIPSQLDKFFPQTQFSSGSFFLASFVLFINIHHYFVDHVIWRRGFGDMQTFLTQKSEL